MKSTPSLFKTADGKNYIVPFLLVTSLFLLWGFCNGMIDVMDKHFQNTLNLTKQQSSWVASANYLGYFLMAIPSGLIARRFGYKTAIIIGLALIATGALCFIPAVKVFNTFPAFLTCLFILATGLTCLETVANPYTTVLGPKSMDATRINIAQTTNGIGWIFGPIVASHFVFSSTGTGASSEGNSGLIMPYIIVAVAVAILATVFIFTPLPNIDTEDEYHVGETKGSWTSIFRHPHFVLAVVAQFFYVAAQTGIFNFFVNYITSEIPPLTSFLVNLLPDQWVYLKNGNHFITDKGAGQLLGYGAFVMFLLGRMVGSFILSRCAAHKTLAAFSVINVAMMGLILLHSGWISTIALFFGFFFMSIMFPTIFALGIHGLGVHSKTASSFIVMAIVGGAIMPQVMGYLGDTYGMTAGFSVPMGCFVVVAAYGFFWKKLSHSDDAVAIAPGKGH